MEKKKKPSRTRMEMSGVQNVVTVVNCLESINFRRSKAEAEHEVAIRRTGLPRRW